MIPDIGLPELLIILVIVLLLFGPGRLAKMMGDLGNGVRTFREAITGKAEEPTQTDPPAPEK